MRVTIVKADLVAALEACNKIKTLKMFGQENLVRITVRDGLTCIDATNLEQHVSVVISEVDYRDAGVVVVDRAMLTAIVKRCDGAIHLHYHLGTLSIADTVGVWTLGVEDAAALPLPPAPDESAPVVMIPMATWHRAMTYAAAATSKEGARMSLLGVSITGGSSHLRLVGTDGRRVHRAQITMSTYDASHCLPVIAPTAWCRATCAGSPASVVSYSSTASSVSATIDCQGISVTHSSRLLEGKFPDVNAVWPPAKRIATEVYIDCEILAAAIDAVSPTASQDDHRVTMSISDDRDIVCQTQSPHGSARRTMQASTVKGKDIQIAFNNNYFVSAITPCDGALEIHLVDASSPITLVLHSFPQDDQPALSLTALVMPLS